MEMIICSDARETTTYCILKNEVEENTYSAKKQKLKTNIKKEKSRVHLPFFLENSRCDVNFHQLETPKPQQASCLSCNYFSSKRGGPLSHEGPYLVAIGAGLYGPGESGVKDLLVTGKKYVETKKDCLESS